MMALFVVGLTGLACVPCGGDERQTLTLTAAFQPTQGGVAWTDELMLTEGFDYTPERLWWVDAIRDASTGKLTIVVTTIKRIRPGTPHPLYSAPVCYRN